MVPVKRSSPLLRKSVTLTILGLLWTASASPTLAAAPKIGKDELPKAVADDNMDEAKRLLDLKADVNGKNAAGSTALHQAVLITAPAGSSEFVKLLLQRGAKPNTKDSEGQTPFMRSLLRAWKSSPEALEPARLLLAGGADVNGKYKDGQTTLMIAAQIGDLPLMRDMLAKKADSRARDPGGKTVLMYHLAAGNDVTALELIRGGADTGGDWAGLTALMLAAQFAKAGTVTALLERKVDTERRDEAGRTALIQAVYRADLDVLKALLDQVDTARTDSEDKTALIHAIESKRLDVAKLLVRGGGDISAETADKQTTLMLAVRHGDVELVKHMLQRGTDTKKRDAQLTTAMMQALHLGRIDIAKELARQGADLTGIHKNGQSNLMLAVGLGDVELVSAMLDKKADTKARDRDGRTALMQALLAGKLPIAAERVRQGADSSGLHKEGQGTLILAVKHGDLPIVKGLISQGQDVNRRDSRGKPALVHAIALGKLDIAKELLRAGARPIGADETGWTPLMHAVAAGDAPLVAQILEAKADIDAKDKAHGMTALMLAAKEGRGAIVKSLLLHGADPKIKNAKKLTAGLQAEIAGHQEIVRLLSKYEAGLARKGAAAPVETVDKTDIQRLLAEAVGKAGTAPAAEAPAAKAYSSEVDQPSYTAAADPDQYAIVVGVEKYSDLPDAQFAERDSDAVRSHLVALGFPERNIIHLKGHKATKTGLAKHLETWLPRNVSEKSTVFFYYSGHGAPDPTSGQAYLLPSDGDPRYLEQTAYPLKKAYETLNSLNVKRVIVALDSCFSGQGGRSVLAAGTRPLVNKVELGMAQTGKAVTLSASRADEISGTAEEQGHGLFTYFLLRGLNGAAKDSDGKVTVKSLFDYLKPNVQDRARRDNREQNPQLAVGADAGPDLTLR